MTYRCHKLPELDNVYWTTRRDMETDSGTYISTVNKPVNFNNRQYIDPWDLESLAYLNRHQLPSREASPTPSPAGEPVSSAFYYIPGSEEDGCTACYAGLDEEMFYNSVFDDEAASSFGTYYTDFESGSSTEKNSSCGSTVSTLQLHTPGFGARASGHRSIVLPKPVPSIEFPAPPPSSELFDDRYQPISSDPTSFVYENNYCSIASGACECYQCCPLENVPIYMTSKPMQTPDDSNRLYDEQRFYPPNNFGLSKKGLLQIDYSFNWNNLHRFIAK